MAERLKGKVAIITGSGSGGVSAGTAADSPPAPGAAGGPAAGGGAP